MRSLEFEPWNLEFGLWVFGFTVWVYNQARQPKKNPREINSEVEKKKITTKEEGCIKSYRYPFVDYVMSALFCLESGMSNLQWANRTLISS